MTDVEVPTPMPVWMFWAFFCNLILALIPVSFWIYQIFLNDGKR